MLARQILVKPVHSEWELYAQPVDLLDHRWPGEGQHNGQHGQDPQHDQRGTDRAAYAPRLEPVHRRYCGDAQQDAEHRQEHQQAGLPEELQQDQCRDHRQRRSQQIPAGQTNGRIAHGVLLGGRRVRSLD